MLQAEIAQQVADRYFIRTAALEAYASVGFHQRSASLHDLTPEVLVGFAEAFTLPALNSKTRTALLGGLGRKLKGLLRLFKKAPKVWARIKEFLGIESVKQIPGKLREMAKKGLKALRKALKPLLANNPVAALYFIPKGKMPGLTDLLQRVVDSSPAMKKVLDRVNTSIIQPIDKVLEKSKVVRTLARPLMASAFIWIWLNVAEISWDVEGLIKGFTGGMSMGELLGSLPESGIGLLVATLFPGLGTFALLPATVMARLLYLLYRKVLSWVKGKGFVVHWDKIGVDRRDELVPVL